MTKTTFIPMHLNATPNDLAGNNGIGRYILLPGSDGRAKEIAEHFSHVEIKTHSRGHHLYLGTLSTATKSIDVATVASGMGCPSMEIILHELFHLGAKRFLRVGTAGSLQADFVKIGDLVNVQASVRDEQTTTDYVPLSVPAVASLDMLLAIGSSAKKIQLFSKIHTGTVHCKSSFYAREFGAGPNAGNNKAYMNLLTHAGVLASEMETATLFIQTQLYNYQMHLAGSDAQHHVLSGAILGIVGIPPLQLATAEEQESITQQLIKLALETIKTLHNTELA